MRILLFSNFISILGYFAYIGYILTEHSHANPVLCVFFYLLRKHAKATTKALNASLISKYCSLCEDTWSLDINLLPYRGAISRRSAVMVLHPSLSSASSQHSLIDLSVISAIFIVHVVLLRPLPLLPET